MLCKPPVSSLRMKAAVRLAIAHAIQTSHMFVYAGVNAGSGVSPRRGSACDARRHMVLLDASPGWFVALVQQAAGAAAAVPAGLVAGRVTVINTL